MTLTKRKRLASAYIREAREKRDIKKLMAVANFILPFRHDKMKAYANLIVVIRRRWQLENEKKDIDIRQRHNLSMNAVSSRVRYRRGLMTPEQRKRYEQNCEWKDHRRRGSFQRTVGLKRVGLMQLAALAFNR